jgi:hypothetical protein
MTMTCTPPLGCLDISLLRDQQDGDGCFSMLFPTERKHGKKVARVLAGVDNDITTNDDNNTTIIYLRGVDVQDGYRGQGYGGWILQVFCLICLRSFDQPPPQAVVSTNR